ncbi:DAZ-associated protein 2 [Lemmus lemmus]
MLRLHTQRYCRLLEFELVEDTRGPPRQSLSVTSQTEGWRLPLELCCLCYLTHTDVKLYRPSFVHPGAATVPTMSAAFPGASLYLPMAQSVAVGPLGSTIPMAYYPVGPIYPPGSAVLVEGGYDAGARFGTGATAGNIPPPPPGCPPNAAQLAVMQGANVLVTQRKGNFFMGGSDGGYTIW